MNIIHVGDCSTGCVECGIHCVENNHVGCTGREYERNYYNDLVRRNEERMKRFKYCHECWTREFIRTCVECGKDFCPEHYDYGHDCEV